ncbi:MAG TPA: TetR/AcrR family transcriptional regulator [Pirellulales bacterium]|nr:TetR/AcrR family transcriptional regulator [Pirellulales bacterium]
MPAQSTTTQKVAEQAATRTPATADSAPGKREERRQAIIEAAARLFAEQGYTACEMERVAAELGIAKGTLYLYFSSKEALFYACVDAGMKQMQSAVLQAADEANNPVDRIARGIRAYLQFFEDHPEHVELLIQERANFKGRSRPTYFEYRDQNREKWRPVHEEMIATGRYRGDIPVERIMDAIGNLLYGTMFTNHFVGRAVSLNEQYQSLLEILMRGLLSEEERAAQAHQPLTVQGEAK